MSSATSTLRLILLGEDKSASKTVKGVGDETEKTSKKMQTFHKVGTAAGVALAGGLVLAGKAAVDMTKKAAEDEASAAKLANTLKHAAGATDTQVASTEKWITAQGKAFGVADDDLRPALSKLAVATGSVTKAQKLAKLAMDVSAGSGKSLESVSFALAKAQNGNVSGLSRLGIATTDAHGKTLSLQQVTENMAKTYKGAASSAAETAAGKQKIMTVQISELQEKIGYALIPVMGKLVDVGMRVIDWIDRNTKLAGILVGVVGGLLAVTWAVSLATKAYATYTKLAAAAQWLWNAAMDANPIGLVVIAIAAFVAGLIIAYKHSATFRAIVQGALHGVLAAGRAVGQFFSHDIPVAFGKVKSAAGNALGWVKSNWPKILAILTGPFGLAVLAIAKNWGKIKDGASAVKGFVTSQFDALVGFVRGLPGRIEHAAQGMFDGIKNAFRAALNWIIDKWNGLSWSIPSVNTHIPGVGSVGGFTISTPDIPRLAKGGIVNRPTVALIGEAGPEAVVPLSRGGSSNRDLGTFTIVVQSEDGRVTQRKLLKLKRENGGLALGLA